MLSISNVYSCSFPFSAVTTILNSFVFPSGTGSSPINVPSCSFISIFPSKSSILTLAFSSFSFISIGYFSFPATCVE